MEPLAGGSDAATDLFMTDEDDAMRDKQEFQPLTPDQHVDVQRQEFRAFEQSDVWAGDEPSAATAADSDPLPFAVPSLLRKDADADVDAPGVASAAMEDEPALGQLVQRLGSSMEKRREMLARQAAAQPSEHVPAAAAADAERDPDAGIDPAAPLPDSFEAARPEEARRPFPNRAMWTAAHSRRACSQSRTWANRRCFRSRSAAWSTCSPTKTPMARTMNICPRPSPCRCGVKRQRQSRMTKKSPRSGLCWNWAVRSR